jgi:hypothetical protein
MSICALLIDVVEAFSIANNDEHQRPLHESNDERKDYRRRAL